MLLCEGDALQFDHVTHSPVSVYAAKLQHFALMHKAKEQKPPAQKKQPIMRR